MSKKKEKNPMIAAAQLGPVHLTVDKETADRVNPKPDRKNYLDEFTDMASRAAKSKLCCRNWKFKNAEKHFPTDMDLRRVDRYFPNAVGGPLLVDEPRSKRDIDNCERKRQAIGKEGQRYVVITEDMELNEILDQLKDTRREAVA